MPSNLKISPLMQFVEEAKAEIAKGNLKTTQTKIAVFFKNSPRLNDFIMQQARLSTLAQQIRNGTISFENKTITTNQIINATLELLDLLSEEEEIFEPIIKKEIIKAIDHCKNLVIDSTINAENVTIGDTIINNYYQNSSKIGFSNLEIDLLTLQESIYKRFVVTEEDPMHIQLPKQTLIKETLSFNLNVIQNKKDISNVGIEKIFFDECLASMLILGAPGSGKTTLLAELGYKITQRSLKIKKGYVPLLFNFTSWSIFKIQKPSASFLNWLIYEARNSIGLIQNDIENLILSKKIICLFDGLDEVAEEDRLSCLQAFNQFRFEHRIKVAITCRREEYDLVKMESENKNTNIVLRVDGAIEILPLYNQQISAYLKENMLFSILTIYQKSHTLQQILNSPLWLSIAVNAYKKQNWEKFEKEQNWKYRLMSYYEDWILNTKLREWSQKQIGIIHVGKNKFKNQDFNKKEFREKNIINWIAWLAFIMNREQLSVFYLERVQPWYLPNTSIRKYDIFSNSLLSVIIGVALTIVFNIAAGLKIGVAMGVFGSFCYYMFESVDKIAKIKLLSFFSFKNQFLGSNAFSSILFRGSNGISMEAIVNGIVLSLIIVLPSTLILSSNYEITDNTILLLYAIICGIYSFTIGISATLVNSLVKNIEKNSFLLKEIEKPNQGLINSLKYASISFVPGVLCLGLFFILPIEMLSLNVFKIQSNFLLGIICIAYLLRFPGKIGIFGYIKLSIIWLLLRREQYVSKHYVKFLNTACRVGYLKRVGGGYRFFHREFQDYLVLKYGDHYKDQYSPRHLLKDVFEM